MSCSIAAVPRFTGAQFAGSNIFVDVDPAIIARDEGRFSSPSEMMEGAWTSYLARMLPAAADWTAGSDPEPSAD